MADQKGSALSSGYALAGDQVVSFRGANNYRVLVELLTNEIFNVKNYGALGDGSNDDTAEIQAAIDAAEAAADAKGGAIVYFPAGEYLVSDTLTVQTDAVKLMGAGAASYTAILSDTSAGTGTLIRPVQAFGASKYVLSLSPALAATRPLNGIRIEGIRVGTHQVLTNTVHGILIKSDRCIGYDVSVDKMTGDGIVFYGRSVADGGSWNTFECKFTACHARNCGGSGVRFAQNTADQHFTDCVFNNCNYGIHFDGNGASMHFVGCHSYSNVLNNVYMDGGGSRSKFIGCKFENSGQHNVNLDCTDSGMSDIHFIGCNFNSGGYATNNTYDNFIVQRASGGNSCGGVLTGSTFQWISTSDNGGTNKPRYHINLSSAVANTWNIGNNKEDTNFGTARYNHNSNAVRCLINGLGINVGDPTSTGQWNSNGVEGAMVVNTSANTIYIYANAAWRALN